MKRIDITSLGEILIDFTTIGYSDTGFPIYEANPGGAPANVAATSGKLGGKVAFIGRTGKDKFGDLAKTALQKCNVDIKSMGIDEEHHTTLAFVTIDNNGERAFSFCRNPGADTQLKLEDIDFRLIAQSTFLHIGSLSLTHDPSRATTLQAIKTAKENKTFISYDPNWRPALWENEHTAMLLMRSLISYAYFVKMSEEELNLLYENGDEAITKMLESGTKLVCITMGEKGTYYKTEFFEGTVPAISVDVVDTTGAGDAFTGAMLYRLTRRENPFEFTVEELEQDIYFANTVAALSITKRGAIPALPTLSEVESLLSQVSTCPRNT